jgi:hypothetical protein
MFYPDLRSGDREQPAVTTVDLRNTGSFAPSGACVIPASFPTVGTVGYCLPRLRRSQMPPLKSIHGAQDYRHNR